MAYRTRSTYGRRAPTRRYSSPRPRAYAPRRRYAPAPRRYAAPRRYTRRYVVGGRRW